MAETKFTPGPWESRTLEVISIAMRKPQLHSYIAKDGVALDAHGEVGRANCLLMAAAPELYAALEKAVNDYGKPGGPWNCPDEPGTWLAMAKAALQKARGEKTNEYD